MQNSNLRAVRLFLMVALLSIATSVTWAGEPSVAGEIEYLISAVSESGCTFVRNGKDHTAVKAADHLQMKAKKGERYYVTTEEFIERIASKSSWSGEPYLIQCDGKPAEAAGSWFTRALATLRASGPE